MPLPGPQSSVFFLLLVAAFAVAIWRAVVSRRVAFRILAGVLAFVPAMLVGVAAVNKYYDYYQTWGSMAADMTQQGAGAASGVPDVKLAGHSRSGTLDGSRAHLELAQQEGYLVRTTVTGQRSRITRVVYVYLPPQYFQPAYARARFPVVLAVTGYPGLAGGIIHRLALPAVAARLIADGRARPTVYVMLTVSPLFPADTECTDIPGGPQVASFLAQDVPRAVEQTFRVTATPAGWGVLGYSTGGYCAVKLAMMYPDRFSAAVSMAGYYQGVRGHPVPGLWGGSIGYWHENSPGWRLRHLPAPPVSVLVTSSRVGDESLPGTLAFLREIRPPMRGYSLIIPEGGHNFRTWSRELTPCLKWLSRRLS